MSLASVHKLTAGAASRDKLEEMSLLYARESEAASDAQLDSLTDAAIKTLKLQEATFWQRVKFRSRMIRAAAGGDKKARKVK